MRFWPFGSNLETRDDSYTDVLIASLVSRAQGKSLAVPSATAALEACSGTVGRGFAAAEVTGPDSHHPRALDTGRCMEMIGRSLDQDGGARSPDRLVIWRITSTGTQRQPRMTSRAGRVLRTWEYTLDARRA